MGRKQKLIRQLADGTKVIPEKGSKAESKWDFLVKYQSPGKRVRSPAHIHLVIDMCMKRMGNPSRTNELVDYMVRTLIEGAKPATGWPPKLEYFDPAKVRRFEPLTASASSHASSSWPFRNSSRNPRRRTIRTAS